MWKQRKLDFNRQFAFGGGGEMSLQRPTTGGEIMRRESAESLRLEWRSRQMRNEKSRAFERERKEEF